MKMQEVVHVLQITTRLGTGGVQSFLINYARHMDTTKLVFDYAVQTEEKQRYDEEVLEQGSHIYVTKSMIANPAGYFEDIYHICKEHPEIKIVHSHLNYRNFLPLLAAKCAGVKIRISHSHSAYNASSALKDIARKMYQFALPLFATEYWGCSQKANRWLYGEKSKEAKSVHNAISTERFRYSDEKRKLVRKSLKLDENDIAIIHVGTFSAPKNHEFLIQMFAQYHNQHANAKLILCGDGVKKEKIINEIAKYNLQHAILMLGMIDNVQDILNAADAFVLPSLYEGAPLSVVEAQTNGLPCVASLAVPEDVLFASNCKRCSDFDEDEWCVAIDEMMAMKEDRKKGILRTQREGFDIDIEAQKLEKLYLTCMEKKK